jgi:hypothetical protein
MRTGQHVSVVIGPPIEVAGCDIGNLMSQVAQFLVKNVENDAVHPRS